MRLPNKHPALFAVGVVATATIGLTACGSSSHSSSSSGPSTRGCTATGAGAGQVNVCETEFHISLSSTAFHAGAMTFVAQNKGAVEHSLEIKGPSVDVTSALLGPGQSADLHVTLQAGSYELWCPVPGHKALGMDTHISVAG